MDKGDLLDLVGKQFGTLHQEEIPPMRIDFMFSVAWHLLFERNGDFCLVFLPVENEIGIADRGVRGYTQTPAAIYEGVDGQKAVDWFNEFILGINPKESALLVLSTL